MTTILKEIIEVNDKYDREFINLILEIEKRYVSMIKQDRLKVESWIKKLCIPTMNKEWKKNRNLHAISLLDMILNNRMEEPYNKFSDDSQTLTLLNQTVVKSKLSEKFYELNPCDKNKRGVYSYSLVNRVDESAKENDNFNVQRVKGKLKENKLLIGQKCANRIGRTLSSYNKNYSDRNMNQAGSNNNNNNNVFLREIENLKKLLNNLKRENKQKDEIIVKQNEEKKRMYLRVKELETAVEKIIADKDQVKAVQQVLLKNKNYV